MARIITRKLDIIPEFKEFDMMGVAHNLAYFNWFERGRFQIFDDIMPMSEFLENNIAVVVCENSCKYFEPITFSQEFTLITRHKINDFYSGKLEFTHELVNKKSKHTHAQGTCICAIVDLQTNKLTKEFPEYLIQKYNSLK